MILLLDNFDSFTFKLVDYFAQLGVECNVIRNDTPLNAIIDTQYKAVVLSPGPETPGKAGVLMEVVAYYYDKLPMLGICLGHQALGTYFGAKLAKASRPMHGKLSMIKTGDSPYFEGISTNFKVVRYHSLLLTEISACLEVMAETDQGEIMGIRHREFPLLGLQFHPEAALTDHGLSILANWITYHRLLG